MVAGMVDARNVTNWIWGLVSAVLLFVVVAHAVAPVGPDHAQGRGSAFSASTEDVSLKSGTRTIVAKEVVRLEPFGPVPWGTIPLSAAVLAVSVQIVPWALVASVPSLAGITLTPISPRAPPIV
jgi:hypothetical protein